MANREEDGDCERWDVKDQEKDGHAVAIIDCHFFRCEESRGFGEIDCERAGDFGSASEHSEKLNMDSW